MIEQLNQIIKSLNGVISEISNLEGAETVKTFAPNKIREAIMSVQTQIDLASPKKDNEI